MEQYFCKMPKSISDKVKSCIEKNEIEKMNFVSKGDSKNFEFVFEGKTYPAMLHSLPCLVESYKTYDKVLHYKSGDIGQMMMVYENDEEEKEELYSGITPPTVNIVKRKFEKTMRCDHFPVNEVIQVSAELAKFTVDGPVEMVSDEIVEFEDWMETEECPSGVTFYDEMQFLKQHPQFITGEETHHNLKKNESAGLLKQNQEDEQDALEEKQLEEDILGDL